jgi:hypothetical protein
MILVSLGLVALFIMHIIRWEGIKVDGYAITLLVLAILPWSLPAFLFAFKSISDAFGQSNLRLIQIGMFKIEQLEKQVEIHRKELAEQRGILDNLIVYSMGYYIYDKLRYITLGTFPEYQHQFGEYKYVRDETFDHDLRYLRDHGYLEMFQLSDLQPGDNLVGKLRATEMGRQFVQLKERGLRAVISSAEEVKSREPDQVENIETRASDSLEGIAAK